MSTHVEDLYALIPSEDADAAVDRLLLKLTDDDVEVRTPEPGRYRRLDERLHSDATAAGRGARLGALGGAVVGAVVGVVLGAGVAVVSMITFGFAAFGALIGGMIGLQRREPEDDDPAVDLVVEESDAVRLVVVRAPHERDWARKVLERQFDARALEADRPIQDDEPPAPEAERVTPEGDDEG